MPRPPAYDAGRKRADAMLLGFREGTKLSERGIADKYRLKAARVQPGQPGGSPERVKGLEAARDRLLAWVRAGSPPLANDGEAPPAKEPAAVPPEAPTPLPSPVPVPPVPVLAAAAVPFPSAAVVPRRPRYAEPESAPLVYKPYRPRRVFHRPLRFYLLAWWPWVREKVGIRWLVVAVVVVIAGALAYQRAMEWIGRAGVMVSFLHHDSGSSGSTDQDMIDHAPPHGHWNAWKQRYDYW